MTRQDAEEELRLLRDVEATLKKEAGDQNLLPTVHNRANAQLKHVEWRISWLQVHLPNL